MRENASKRIGAAASPTLSKAPIAVSTILEAVRNGHLSLEEGLKKEATLFAKTFETDDFREGVAAFIEKRGAEFKGT